MNEWFLSFGVLGVAAGSFLVGFNIGFKMCAKHAVAIMDAEFSKDDK